jgi:hypothetical protein
MKKTKICAENVKTSEMQGIAGMLNMEFNAQL